MGRGQAHVGITPAPLPGPSHDVILRLGARRQPRARGSRNPSNIPPTGNIHFGLAGAAGANPPGPSSGGTARGRAVRSLHRRSIDKAGLHASRIMTVVVIIGIPVASRGLRAKPAAQGIRRHADTRQHLANAAAIPLDARVRAISRHQQAAALDISPPSAFAGRSPGRHSCAIPRLGRGRSPPGAQRRPHARPPARTRAPAVVTARARAFGADRLATTIVGVVVS